MKKMLQRISPFRCQEKRCFGIVWRRMSLALLLVMLTSLSAWADEGSCGTNVTYTYEGNTLTISGTGAMADYEFAIDDYSNTGYKNDLRPWKDSRGDIYFVIIKKGVTHIGKNAFAMCTYLKSITFENGSEVSSIGDYAFYDCGDYELASISIPASVTSIGDYAFANCNSLQSVSVYAETPPALGENAFTGIDENAEFLVRNEDYKTASNWSVWEEKMTLLDANNLDIPYIDANGQSATCSYATPITSSDDYFDCNQDLWFYVTGEVTIGSILQFYSSIGEGSTNIILCDGATLTVNSLSAGNNLNIYGQENNSGVIIVNDAISTEQDLTLNGGTISVSAAEGAYGIISNGNTIINGGTISVSAADGAYGISSYGNTIINGGTISVSTVENATVESFTGYYVDNALIINGGTINVSATGDYNYGITTNGNITINGGEVSVTVTGNDTYGISSGIITLAGGTITASSYDCSSVVIAEDIVYTDGTDTYSGTLNDVTALAGKTLTVVPDITKIIVNTGSMPTIVLSQVGNVITATLYGVSDGGFSITEDVAVADVKLDRTFESGNKVAICWPFAVEASKAASLGKFYQFTGITTEGKITMEEVTGDLVANTPYIFEPSSTNSTPIDFGAQTLKAGGPQSVGSGFTFKGIYDRVKWTRDDTDPLYNAAYAAELGMAYGFALEQIIVGTTTYMKGQFVKLGSGAHSRALRAYMLYDGVWDNNQPSVGVRKRSEAQSLPDVIDIVWISANGVITGIDDINRETVNNNGWYSLDGRKLSGKPTVKGMYINNGNKVVIK